MVVATRSLHEKTRKVKLVLTDCDGVLTDAGVYYGENGEVMKRFNIRDGMAVELLRAAGIDTGIVTGELSPSVRTRAEKLKITELHLGCKDKATLLKQIAVNRKISLDEIAFIGDDVNDLEALHSVGLSACPKDAVEKVRRIVDLVCEISGGHGAFRELAEMILAAREGASG